MFSNVTAFEEAQEQARRCLELVETRARVLREGPRKEEQAFDVSETDYQIRECAPTGVWMFWDVSKMEVLHAVVYEIFPDEHGKYRVRLVWLDGERAHRAQLLPLLDTDGFLTPVWRDSCGDIPSPRYIGPRAILQERLSGEALLDRWMKALRE